MHRFPLTARRFLLRFGADDFVSEPSSKNSRSRSQRAYDTQAVSLRGSGVPLGRWNIRSQRFGVGSLDLLPVEDREIVQIKAEHCSKRGQQPATATSL
jgi:hypothetical protein